MNIWCEKYRPKTIDECILPSRLKDVFNSIIEKKDLNHLLLHGSAGIGKTSVAKALCNQLGYDYLMINASDDRNIDTLRTNIKQFASSYSLEGNKKVVIYDEADHSNPTSTQPALRGVMEQMSKNCSFILTANYPNKIIEPLHSRCSVHSFNLSQSEKLEVFRGFITRCTEILKKEEVNYDVKVLASFIKLYFPDFRRIINELQRYSKTYGIIDSGILNKSESIDVSELYTHLKNKSFQALKKWVSENGKDQSMYRMLYDTYDRYIDKESFPKTILIINDYQYKSYFCVDQEINSFACLLELVGYCKFL